MASFPVVSGEIIHSEVITLDRRKLSMSSEKQRFDYKAEILYRYQVNGKTFEGQSLYRHLPNIFSRIDLAKKAVSQYPESSRILVHYNPARPEESWLQNSNLPMGMIFIILLIVLSFIAAFIFVVRLQNK